MKYPQLSSNFADIQANKADFLLRQKFLAYLLSHDIDRLDALYSKTNWCILYSKPGYGIITVKLGVSKLLGVLTKFTTFRFFTI